MLHIPLTNLLLLTVKQEPCKKAYLLMKNTEEFSGKKSAEWTSRQKKKTERVTELARRTREETAKWNQMTALRFQTGGRHQISTASLQGATEIYNQKLLWILFTLTRPVISISLKLGLRQMLYPIETTKKPKTHSWVDNA